MSPLSIKPFRNLWLGQAISQMGDAFYYVIFAFMVKKVTHSSAMVGFTSALEALPFLLLSAYAGVVADRIDRRRVMLCSDLCCAAVLILFAGLLLFSGTPPVWAMMASAASLSVLRVFFMPAKGATIPAIVPKDMVLKANSVSAATQNIVPLLSLAVSAAVLSVLYALSPNGFFLCAVLLNALSFLGSAVFIAKLPPVIPDRTDAHEAHPMQDMKNGLAYMRSRHEMITLLGLQVLLNLVLSPFFVVYLAANDAWFGGKPQNLAFFEASFFLGMVISSFLVGKLKPRSPGWCYIIATAGVGVTIFAMGFTPHELLFVCWNFIAGLFLPFSNITVSTYLQMTVPDAYRGRVTSALTMASMGIQPIGMALGGVLIQSIGVVGGFAAMGGATCLGSLIGLLDSRFRSITLPDEKPGPSEGLAAAGA